MKNLDDIGTFDLFVLFVTDFKGLSTEELIMIDKELKIRPDKSELDKAKKYLEETSPLRIQMHDIELKYKFDESSPKLEVIK